MIPGQISIFDFLNEKPVEANYFTDWWNNTPPQTFIFENQIERKHLNKLVGLLVRQPYEKIAHHVCLNMPKDYRVVSNVCYENYFVHAKIGVSEGKHVDFCPYCNANLSNGEGDVIIFKKRRNDF